MENKEEILKVAEGLGKMYADLKILEAQVDAQIESGEDTINESKDE